jgi:hypothetical protein
MPVNLQSRTESSPSGPACALFAALGSTGEAPPPPAASDAGMHDRGQGKEMGVTWELVGLAMRQVAV